MTEVKVYASEHEVVKGTEIHFFNPITGESEIWRGQADAINRVLASAAKRINELQEQIDDLRRERGNG